jgi:hypothetical protein
MYVSHRKQFSNMAFKLLLEHEGECDFNQADENKIFDILCKSSYLRRDKLTTINSPPISLNSLVDIYFLHFHNHLLQLFYLKSKAYHI